MGFGAEPPETSGPSEKDSDLRSELTSEQRLADLKLVIDPGFVNHRGSSEMSGVG